MVELERGCRGLLEQLKRELRGCRELLEQPSANCADNGAVVSQVGGARRVGWIERKLPLLMIAEV